MTPTNNPQPQAGMPGLQAPQEQYIPFRGNLVPLSTIKQLSPEDQKAFTDAFQKDMAEAKLKQPAGTNVMDNPWVQRAGFGGAMAALTAATGGGALPMLGAGALGAAFPPQTGSEAAMYGLSELMKPAYAAAQAVKSPLTRMLANMGVGAGQEGVNAGVRAAAGDQPTSPLSAATSVLLPGLTTKLGGAADTTLQKEGLKTNIAQAVEQYSGKPIGPQLEQLSGRTPEMQQTMDEMQTNFIKSQNTQKAAQAIQKQIGDVQQQRAKLLTQYMGPDSPTEVAALNQKYQKLSKYVPQEFEQESTQIGQIQAHIADTQRNIEQKIINPDVGAAQIAALKAQQTQVEQQILSKKVDTLKNAAQSQIEEQLTGNTKALKGLQDTFDGIQKEIKDDPFQNVYLQNLVASDPKNPTTLKTFVSNIVNSDSEHIEALYKYLGGLPDGEAKIKGLQGALINEFLNKAWDPKTNSLANAAQLTSASGPFNSNKLEALFGSGVEGRQNLQVFKQLTSDVRSLTEMQSQSKIGGSDIIRPQFIAIPGAFLLHHVGGASYPVAFTASELAAVTVVSAPRLFQAAMSNPALAKGIHDFAASGGTAKLNPIVSNWFTKNGSKY